jgi:Lamin Tail Domain
MHIIILIVVFLLSGALQQVSAEIILSEIYPAPSQGYEWVEICNTADEPISLASYTIHDSANKSIYVPKITLQPDQYVLATASGVLNNTGDSIYLRKSGVIIETMTYDSAVTSAQSFVKCSEVWGITTDVSPGFQNPSCGGPTPTHELTPRVSPMIISPVLTAATITTTPTKRPTTGEPTPTVYSLPTTQVTPQLFTQKHQPYTASAVLSAENLTGTMTPTPTAFVLQSPSPQEELSKVMIMLVTTISVGISSFLIYRLVRKFKDSYNEGHDP